MNDKEFEEMKKILEDIRSGITWLAVVISLVGSLILLSI